MWPAELGGASTSGAFRMPSFRSPVTRYHQGPSPPAVRHRACGVESGSAVRGLFVADSPDRSQGDSPSSRLCLLDFSGVWNLLSPASCAGLALISRSGLQKWASPFTPKLRPSCCSSAKAPRRSHSAGKRSRACSSLSTERWAILHRRQVRSRSGCESYSSQSMPSAFALSVLIRKALLWQKLQYSPTGLRRSSSRRRSPPSPPAGPPWPAAAAGDRRALGNTGAGGRDGDAGGCDGDA
mmetsp:Transcript_99119/g.305529  ORF Transcript_99119/g.305529 Transcript_99119/m.305529 type:complete len:239 (-) Transcript_99119:298-1014(-)